MRLDLVKGLVQLELSGPLFTFRLPIRTSLALAFGLTKLAIEYNLSAGKDAKDIKTVIEPAINANYYECIMQKSLAKQLTNLAKIPKLIVTSEASFYALIDYCTVKYLKQVSVDVEFADLSKEGIHSNRHMLFIEKNNL